MQATNLHILQGNLYEIYAALETQQNGNLPLGVTSKGGLYYQSYLTTLVITIGDKILQWMQPNPTPVSLNQALTFTLITSFNTAVHDAYQARLQRIWHHMRQLDQVWEKAREAKEQASQRERYVHYLNKELAGSLEVNNPLYLQNFDRRPLVPLNKDEERYFRHLIVNFQQATERFWKLFISNQAENMRLRASLMPLIEREASASLTDRILFKALKKEKMWVNFEGIVEQDTPITLLAKLCEPQQLTVEEKRRLKFWIQEMNRCEKEISPKLFKVVLTEIIEVIRLQGSSSLTLQDLVYWLDQEGCLLVQREDPAHMDKREGLQPGGWIKCNGKELRVGDQLSPEKAKGDRYKIFGLIDYPHYVVKIACNCFHLLLEAKQAKNEQDHWGVRFVETIDNLEENQQRPAIHGLDRKGRCVVIEKLFKPLKDHWWRSKTFQLTEEDEKIALVLANHFYCMQGWKASVQNLSFVHLMWDKEGVLKATRIFKKRPSNYNEWENYCEEAAKGNFYVLSFLIHVSRLNEHDMALYYRKAIGHTLETGQMGLIGQPLPIGHRNDCYHLQVKSLCLAALDLYKTCFELIVAQLRKQKKYVYKQETQLKKEIAAKLLECYQASPTPGKLSPSLQEEVIHSFLSPIKKEKQPVFDVKAYYQQKHEEMMKYNQALLKKD